MKIRKFVLVIVAFLLLLTSCAGSETPTLIPDLPTIDPSIPTATAAIEQQPSTATATIEQPTAPAPTETMTTEATAEQVPTETTVSSTDTPVATALPTCGPPTGWVIYIVQANNTLFSLAKWTNTTVEQVQQANCMNNVLIYVGQPLYLPFIPVPPPTATIPPPPTLLPTWTAVPTAEAATETPTATPTIVIPTAPGPGDPRVEVVPGSGPAGTTFTFKIRDFDDSEVITVQITYDIDDTIIDSFEVTMDADGNKDVEWESPSDLAAGPYVVTPIRSDGSPGDIGEFRIN